jgi:undecaprenyl pyrophosphate synthase
MKKTEAQKILTDALKAFAATETPAAHKVRVKLQGALTVVESEWTEPKPGAEKKAEA